MMKDEFTTYLRDIEMDETLIRRVIQLYDAYEPIFPTTPSHIFVEDYINDEGGRVFEHLNIFADRCWLSFDSFVTQEKLNISWLGVKITIAEIDMKDYDFKHSNQRSRLTIQVNFTDQKGGILRGARNNCDYLARIIKEYFWPNSAQ